MGKDSNEQRRLGELREELIALTRRNAAVLAQVAQVHRRIQELSERLAAQIEADGPSNGEE